MNYCINDYCSYSDSSSFGWLDDFCTTWPFLLSMSDKLEIPQIVENVTDDRFGMCPICNKAKWCHTNDEKVSCNTQITMEGLKNEIRELKETLS